MAEHSIARFLVWDMTTPYDYPGLTDAARESILPRLADAGYGCATISLAGDQSSVEQTITTIARTRAYVRANSNRFALAETAADIRACRRAGKMAVVLQFQGTESLRRDINLVELYYKVGVRLMLMAYNQKNAVGDGCMERFDGGLSRYGESVVREMNRVGMLVDVTHTGYKTARDVLALSTAPVILSHSNPLALAPNPRNVPDDIIQAVASSGGVMGITGIGRFLTPDNDSSSEQIVRHINYVADLVGPQHVGLGLDWMVDLEAALRLFAANPDIWPDENLDDPDTVAVPEQVREVAALLLQDGWSDTDLAGVLGENWLRVADAVWAR